MSLIEAFLPLFTLVGAVVVAVGTWFAVLHAVAALRDWWLRFQVRRSGLGRWPFDGGKR